MGSVVALVGQVGGAKLADGLYRLRGRDLTLLVNTGDDYEHLGLAFCPDLDTAIGCACQRVDHRVCRQQVDRDIDRAGCCVQFVDDRGFAVIRRNEQAGDWRGRGQVGEAGARATVRVTEGGKGATREDKRNNDEA